MDYTKLEMGIFMCICILYKEKRHFVHSEVKHFHFIALSLQTTNSFSAQFSNDFCKSIYGVQITLRNVSESK